MTSGVFIEAISRGDMSIGIAEIHVRRTNVGRRDGKAQECVLAGGNTAFLDATEARGQLFVAHDPVL